MALISSAELWSAFSARCARSVYESTGCYVYELRKVDHNTCASKLSNELGRSADDASTKQKSRTKIRCHVKSIAST